jgi:hypothetical protein
MTRNTKERLKEYVESEEKDPEVAMLLIGQADEIEEEQKGDYNRVIGRFDDVEVTAAFDRKKNDDIPDMVGHRTI